MHFLFCMILRWRSAFLGALLLHPAFLSATTPEPHQADTLWNLPDLCLAPGWRWGAETGGVREVYYQGEPFRGKPTWVFAYYGAPTNRVGRVPGVLLVHGGGGKAFRDWVQYWNRRGYAALAMDTAGCGPAGPLPDGGPDQSDPTKFRPFQKSEAKDMWTYHAVAAILRGHSLLAAQPEVDPDRIGITGISWGGYLTCIVAGVDPRLKVAVPVYGCGFLAENSCWKKPFFDPMEPELKERWVSLFDPGSHVGHNQCPMLFLNGSNDFAYPMDSYRKTVRRANGPKTLSIQIHLPHGHIWTFPEVDAFIDAALLDQDPLPEIGPLWLEKGQARAWFRSHHRLARAALHYTSDRGHWQLRRWEKVPARIRHGMVEAAIPPNRPLVLFLSITDSRGLTVSNPYRELAKQR